MKTLNSKVEHVCANNALFHFVEVYLLDELGSGAWLVHADVDSAVVVDEQDVT